VTNRFAGLLLALSAAVPSAAMASNPASHEVTLPTKAGESVTVEWTGTALPGVSGASGSCVLPADDTHAITLTVPSGLYDSATVIADFHIEWAPGTPVALTTDPDLVLSVTDAEGTVTSSDGAAAEENVRLTNPAAGTLTAAVCPFFASGPTAYTAKASFEVKATASCVSGPSTAKSNAMSLAAPNGTLLAELKGLRNFDSLQNQTWNRTRKATPTVAESRIQSTIFDRPLGTSTFLWAQQGAKAIAVGALSSERDILIARARAQLRVEAKKLGLTEAMISQAKVVNAQYNGGGPAVVRFRQTVNGLEVFHRYLNVLIDQQGRPVAVSGYFASDYETPSTSFAQSSAQAIAKAWANLGGTLNPLSLKLAKTKGEYQLFSLLSPLTGSHVFEREPRIRRMYYESSGKLVPAYYVELFSRARANGALSAYALIVSATDGVVLHRENLQSDATAFTYRAHADAAAPFEPFDSPLGNGYTPFPEQSPNAAIVRTPAADNVVTLVAGPISTADPWLADDATETLGNNVDACLDSFDTPLSGIISNPLNTCTPELGDMRATTSSDHSFDYAVVADTDPSTASNQAGAIVNLFFINNWLHDWWYDHGFDEASGNAQNSNYDRGGEEGDPIKAQGQDGSGRNNANMSTPADGSSPTMQQYLFDGPVTGDVRQLTPIDSGSLKFTGASFGPGTFNVEAAAVLAADGFGDSPTDGCGVAIPDPTGTGLIPSPPALPQASLAGRIALVDRGNCNFTTKAQFALLSGAAALVVINNADTDPISMGNADIPISVGASPTDAIYQIPSVMIRKDAGDAIKAQLAAGSAVTMRVKREASIDADGTVDNQIVSHEFFHYVHHRLTDSSNQQSGAMSEGWGDIDALMLSVRESDKSIRGNDKYQGAYGLAGYVIFNFYNGIRRAPYSTDFAKNAFTLKHISDGEPTPDGGPGTSNSEVHNAGELWANQMWECYAGILNRPGVKYADARNRMKDYIIGGLKMTPADATFTEARDAVLSVVYATDYEDYKVCSAGFAKRGSGLNAIAPARDSTDLTGVTEDYTPFVCETSNPGEPSEPGNPTNPGGPSVDGNSKRGGSLDLELLLPFVLLAFWRRRARSA
jgi:hypothetical protein